MFATMVFEVPQPASPHVMVQAVRVAAIAGVKKRESRRRIEVPLNASGQRAASTGTAISIVSARGKAGMDRFRSSLSKCVRLPGLRELSASKLYFLDELRRSFNRARTVENKAPAAPTRPRTTVGFSGEFVQPSWACRGRATARRDAEHRKSSNFLFMIALGSKSTSTKNRKSTTEIDREAAN